MLRVQPLAGLAERLELPGDGLGPLRSELAAAHAADLQGVIALGLKPSLAIDIATVSQKQKTATHSCPGSSLPRPLWSLPARQVSSLLAHLMHEVDGIALKPGSIPMQTPQALSPGVSGAGLIRAPCGNQARNGLATANGFMTRKSGDQP